MAKGLKIDVSRLAVEVEDIGKLYLKSVTEGIDSASQSACHKLVSRTRATAPSRTGRFRQNIDSREVKTRRGFGRTFAWYVKAPDYRLTHLLVHGHATRDGGRTKANPFLRNALSEVLPEYENEVRRVLENG